MKKILSSVLCAVMIFMTVVVLIPTRAEAAYSPSTVDATATLSKEEIKALFKSNSELPHIKNIYTYNFNNAREMLEYEQSMGYITRITIGDYTLHANKYTGYVYYENNITGQILTSNPYVSVGDGENKAKSASQILLNYIDPATSALDFLPLASSTSAGENGQISVSYIKNGIRVNYTLGDITQLILPVAVRADKFEEMILKPLLEVYKNMLLKYDPTLSPEQCDFFAAETWYDELYNEGLIPPVNEVTGLINSGAFLGYLEETKSIIQSAGDEGYAEYDTLDTLYRGMSVLVGSSAYNLCDPEYQIYQYENGEDVDREWAIDELKNMFSKYPVTGHWDGGLDENGNPKEGTKPVAGTPIYVIVTSPTTKVEIDKLIDFETPTATSAIARQLANLISTYTSYTLSDVTEDEIETDLSRAIKVKPVFRCSLEYVINSDGTLKISLPTSSISFDESVYTLKDITPLKYFGNGTKDSKYESYAMFPDGSGMICDFSDYQLTEISNDRAIFGTDYAYSELKTIYEYQEQVAMPVYGVVREVPSSTTPGKTVMNGYFAIIEEGAALGTLNMFSHKAPDRDETYANVYVSYAPYPTDKFWLTGAAAGTSSTESFYYLTLSSKYSGSFTTNITMLTDPELKQTHNLEDAYVADYNGMAKRYRDYLIKDGSLSALNNIQSGSTPLYIETLGAIEIVKKYLTFPVNVNIPLTTFEDVLTMYNELANAKQTLLDMAAKYQKEADETSEDDLELKEFNLKKAQEYKALSEKVQNITNVNFKLTGFANDGMNNEYPTKVKWESACGGKGGFAELTEKAEEISAAANANLGIYPEFDFMFLEMDTLFSGVKRWDKARMIDNRYASKQIYNPSDRMYYPGYGSVINTAALEKLFGKFEDSYSEFDWKYLSLSTFGSSLNSNFDRDDPVNRDMSIDYITGVLDSVVKDNYSVMVDKGNAYTYAYADHIVNLSLDSSQHAYCSYAIPFVGMVLHGYINYAGTPINYSGSAEYDVLKSIENGASLYYTLCYQNTALMKDSMIVNSYYSVNYATWFERMVDTYASLNGAIGDLQDYQIVEHKALIAEKLVTAEVEAANAKNIQDEFITLLDAALRKAVNEKLLELKNNNSIADKTISLNVDVEALCLQLERVTNLPKKYIDADFKARINGEDGVLAQVKEYFNITTGANAIVVDKLLGEGTDDYTSKYDYFTTSLAEDEDYNKTFYSVANNNVVMVTYAKYDQSGNVVDEVKFVLNYNIDKVSVKLAADAEPIILGKYEFAKVTD